MFKCLECGRKFKSVSAAEKASRDGCPKCGGVDIDLAESKPTTKRERKPVERHLSIVHQEGDTVIVGITVGKTFAHYFITPIAADFGSAFTVEKQSEDGKETVETYHVNVNGNEQLCDCRGAGVVKRDGGCKHAAAVSKLQELQVLPKAMPNPYETVTSMSGSLIETGPGGATVSAYSGMRYSGD